MSKANKKKLKTERLLRYVVAVSKWNWDYYFGLNWVSRDPEKIFESKTLSIIGTFLKPDQLKNVDIELRVTPFDGLKSEHRNQIDPKAVGEINRKKGDSYSLLACPPEIVPEIIAALSAGKIKFIVMDGEKLRYGNAQLNSYRMQETWETGEDC